MKIRSGTGVANMEKSKSSPKPFGPDPGLLNAWRGISELKNRGILKVFQHKGQTCFRIDSKRLPEDCLLSILTSPKSYSEYPTMFMQRAGGNLEW